jgi:hypothetical protein
MPNAKRIRATLKASDKTLEPAAPDTGLTATQRKEIAQAKRAAIKADTEAALARPSQLTPLQLKRLAISEALKAKRKAKHTPKQPPETN